MKRSPWCLPIEWPYAARLMGLQHRCQRQYITLLRVADTFGAASQFTVSEPRTAQALDRIRRMRRNWRAFS